MRSGNVAGGSVAAIGAEVASTMSCRGTLLGQTGTARFKRRGPSGLVSQRRPRPLPPRPLPLPFPPRCGLERLNWPPLPSSLGTLLQIVPSGPGESPPWLGCRQRLHACSMGLFLRRCPSLWPAHDPVWKPGQSGRSFRECVYLPLTIRRTLGRCVTSVSRLGAARSRLRPPGRFRSLVE